MSLASEYANGGDEPDYFGVDPKHPEFDADVTESGDLRLISWSERIYVDQAHVPAFIAWLRKTYE